MSPGDDITANLRFIHFALERVLTSSICPMLGKVFHNRREDVVI